MSRKPRRLRRGAAPQWWAHRRKPHRATTGRVRLDGHRESSPTPLNIFFCNSVSRKSWPFNTKCCVGRRRRDEEIAKV